MNGPSSGLKAYRPEKLSLICLWLSEKMGFRPEYLFTAVRSSFIITGRIMDIKDFFSGMFSNKPKNVLQTPYGNFNLAKGKDISKRVQKMVIDLQRTTDAPHRGHQELARYIIMPSMWTVPAASACDIYRDAEIDLHLSGCGAAQRFCHGTFFQNRGYERG